MGSGAAWLMMAEMRMRQWLRDVELADGILLPDDFPSESNKGRLSRSLGMVCGCFHNLALLRTDFWSDSHAAFPCC